MATQRGGDDEDLVRLYLRDIGRHRLLTKDDEVQLARTIEAGAEARRRLAARRPVSASERANLRRQVKRGDTAERRFVESNLRLVVSIAKRYQASGVPLLDLVQEGNLGLIHAVEKFDWRKGFKFSTYATWWIRQAITRGIANTGRTIRVPVHAGDMLARLQKLRVESENTRGRPATETELADAMDLPIERIREALRFAADPISLSEPLRTDGEGELGDMVEDTVGPSPFDRVAQSMLPAEVAKLLELLEPREREVLRLRYGLDRGEPRTLEEVGRVFGLTRERIRQVEARAMSKLRHPSIERGVRDLIA